jgi:hypothetical protein
MNDIKISPSKINKIKFTPCYGTQNTNDNKEDHRKKQKERLPVMK